LNGFAQFYLGEIYFDIGEYEKSDTHFSKAIWLFEQNRSSPSTANLAKLGLVRTRVLKNDKAVHWAALNDNEYESHYKIHDGLKARYFSEILLHIDNQHLCESEDRINIAIKADKKNGMMLHLGKNYASYAYLSTRKDDQHKAKENLCKAIEIFNKCGADGWAEKYEKELAAL
jgi:tetratricopeptide (TPR) repeat protein